MNITIYGTGYVGLVQAAVLADVGHDVCCMDNEAEKVAILQKGIVYMYELGLSELVLTNVLAGGR